MDKKAYDYWLYGLEAVGRKTFLKLRENGYDGFSLYHCYEKEIPSFLTEKQKASIINGKSISEEMVKREFQKIKTDGIFMTVFGDEKYPKKLYKIPDAPAVLFYKGRLPDERQKSIAIIGARNCSQYGKIVAEQFASYLALKNVCVVSGMASGIDGYAQKAALHNNGFSVGVLGSGVNVCYPKENYGIYNDLVKKGCVLSEYLPYINASANLFPQRNRIISGLSDALIVVEAKEKSGTLVTVEMALEQGKEVFVVPGRITDELSKGCNRLLWEGANPAIHPEKVLETVYGIKSVEEREHTDETSDSVQKIILSFLDVTPVHINVLQEQTGLAMDVLGRELLMMVLDDSVIQVGNSWYRRKINHL